MEIRKDADSNGQSSKNCWRKCIFYGLLVFVSILLLIAVALLVRLNLLSDETSNSINSNGEQVCSTPECVAMADRITSAMNVEVHPCENLYEFVCGRYMDGKKEKLQETMEFWRVEKIMQERMVTTLNEKIESTDTKVMETIKTYFKSCMNLEAIERMGIIYIRKAFEELGGWPCVVGDDWNSIMWQDLQLHFLRKGFGETYLMGAFYSKPREDIFILSPNSLIGKYNVENYYKYMVEMAMIFGANVTTATSEMWEVIEFLTKIKNEVK